MGKTLIAYYSRAGENIANGMTVMLSEGNTEDRTGGPLFG